MPMLLFYYPMIIWAGLVEVTQEQLYVAEKTGPQFPPKHSLARASARKQRLSLENL